MKCENCNKEHDGKYGTGRFCEQRCAKSYASNTNKEEANKKISASLTGRGNKPVDKICEACGEPFTIRWVKRNQKNCSRKCGSKTASTKRVSETKIETEYPYNEYVGYLVTNPENRRNVCLVHKESKKRTTVSYARYLMSVKEKRLLEKHEIVDHIDNDQTNDVIENFQIVDVKENNRKSRENRNIKRKYLLMKCPNCNNEFEKQQNQSFLVKKDGKYNVCSMDCLYEMNTKRLTKEELIEIGKNQIIKEFHKETY